MMKIHHIKRKIIILNIIFLILSASVSTIYACSNTKIPNQIDNHSSEVESHLIKGVPYVAKQEGFSCEYAPLEMVFRYYNINVTTLGIFYSIGGGYAQGYGVPLTRVFHYPYRKLPYKFICNGDRTCGGTEDYKFLANLYGCSFDYIDYDLVINKQKCWNEYWEKVKYYVKNNIPVITTVDPLSWSPYRELENISYHPSIFSRSCCVIVIVGYNETNNTICFHDQYVGYKNASKKGKYQWIGIDKLKIAAGRPRWEMNEMRYAMLLVEKISDPLPQHLIIELVHKRNIKKMMGLKEAYDSDFIHKNFKVFGINALKSLKGDIKYVFIKRIPFYKMLNNIVPSLKYPFARVIKYFDKEALNKHQIANYIFENENISEKYLHDAILLERESGYWENLKNLTIILKGIVFTNPIHQALPQYQLVLDKMCNVIDDIIVNHKMIIAQSKDIY